jgi:hypothetical protein
MHAALILIILLIPAISKAGDGMRLFAEECRQIKPEATGFSCLGPRGGVAGPWFKMNKPKKAMKPEEFKRVQLEIEKLIWRYHNLGGSQFQITYPDWPKAKYIGCSFYNQQKYSCAKIGGT